MHTFCAAFGLSLILTTSATLFHLVKYAGAAYLIYLGIKIFRDRSQLFESCRSDFQHEDLIKIYRQGVITNVLNPKVALFFLSFLPQFIRAEQGHGPLPFLILGATFLMAGTLWCLFLAYAASMMTSTLRRNAQIGQALQKLSGIVFVGLGLQLASKQH